MSRPRTPRDVQTRAIHGASPHFGPMSTPIVHSSTFTFPDLASQDAEQAKHAAGAFYQRYGHPTVNAVEARLAELEDAGAALLFASGMAAIASVCFARLRAGDHVVALEQCYGGTPALLRWGAERFGWTHTLVDARDAESFDAAFRPNTRLFLVESPTNPTLCVVDLTDAARIAHRRGAWLVVDNTVASPLGQRPLELGADVVVYSATKSIGGHGDLLAGLAVGSAESLGGVYEARKVFGPTLDPTSAWQIERSLKTLPLRVEHANRAALELAVRLQGHAAVERVFYPGLIHHPGHEIARQQMTRGFGPLLSFDVRGGLAAAEAVVDAFEIVGNGPSLGGVESLASLPAHTSHAMLGAEGRARAGIPDGCVRLSVGLEAPEDLWADLDQALHRATRSVLSSRPPKSQ